jgi:hypothetical protein
LSTIHISLEEVLNPRIEETLRFPLATCGPGVILGRGGVRIPDKYASFSQVPFTLILYDQFGEEITAQGHLSVGERTRKHRNAIYDHKRTRLQNPDLVSRIGREVPDENTHASISRLAAHENEGKPRGVGEPARFDLVFLVKRELLPKE